MKNNLNPILCFRKELNKNINSKLMKNKVKLKTILTMITETRESIDSSENT